MKTKFKLYTPVHKIDNILKMEKFVQNLYQKLDMLKLFNVFEFQFRNFQNFLLLKQC